MYNDNYANCTNDILNGYASESPCVPAEPIEPLVAIVEDVRNGTETALQMAYRINEHLFGMGEPTKEEGMNPRCFRDVMVKQRQDISDLCDELAKIKERLGI